MNIEAIITDDFALAELGQMRELRASADRAGGGMLATLPKFAELTGRESAIVWLAASGARGPAIAGALGISPRTVHKHLENVYRKLGVHSLIGALTHVNIE